MIQMLSRFNLTPGAALSEFIDAYRQFCAMLKDEGLVEAAGPVCRRVADTPMDTDAPDAPQFYSVMTFRGRAQLDAAYARFAASMAGHEAVLGAVRDATFTVWRELD